MNSQKVVNIILSITLSMVFLGLIIPLQANSKGGIAATLPEAQQPELPLFRLHRQASQPILIDHTTTDITAIPQVWIEEAKRTLHIGYGHTSHGSQLTSGMSGLVAFANGGGLGLTRPENIFQFNSAGNEDGNSLHLFEGDGYGSGDLDHDCGYFPNGINETRAYLGTPDPGTGRGTNHSEINVIIWSWCGQVASHTEQSLLDSYLLPMSQLEQDYPGVVFVYMTGHADGSGETGNLHPRNQQIRQYALANNKVLYDFFAIELYDPAGTYYGDRNVNDECYYDSDGNGSRDKNWAADWQNSHPEGEDWYSCSCAHSQAVNCNQKAYAAWWLWARLAGWAGSQNPSAPLTIQKTVSSLAPHNGQPVTYTIVIQDLATPPAGTTMTLTDELPAGLVYASGSLTATSGLADDILAPALHWSGILSPTPIVTIAYAAIVSTPVTTPLVIPNTALLEPAAGETISATAAIILNAKQCYLPVMLK